MRTEQTEIARPGRTWLFDAIRAYVPGYHVVGPIDRNGGLSVETYKTV